MIYTIPHVTKFGSSFSELKIQWETVHLPPARKDGNGGSVFLSVDWLEYIRAMNTPEAFKWMIGMDGTIIWGVKDRKNIGSKKNNAKMPVIAIGGNQIDLINVSEGWGRVVGLREIDYQITPKAFPMYWHRIYCLTKLPHAKVSKPHDTPRGPAYMPILDVSAFKRTKALAAGVTYCKVV